MGPSRGPGPAVAPEAQCPAVPSLARLPSAQHRGWCSGHLPSPQSWNLSVPPCTHCRPQPSPGQRAWMLSIATCVWPSPVCALVHEHVCACVCVMFRCEHVCTACERMCACVHLRVSVCCAYMCVRVCPSVRVYAAVCVIYAHHVCACVPLYECTWPCVCNLCTCMHWLCVCAHVCERQDSGLLRSHPGFDTVPGPLQ